MREKKELKTDPIGSTFKEGDVTLRVVEIKDFRTCTGCYYANRKRYGRRACYLNGHACTAGNRSDKKQVVFEVVNPEP